jgi:uncharacterized membrane protein YvbJ
MVFCRGCGKELHETAPTCPQCGAPQGNLNSVIKDTKETLSKITPTLQQFFKYVKIFAVAYILFLIIATIYEVYRNYI